PSRRQRMINDPDEDFVLTFIHGTLATGGFHHRDHLHLTWLLLRQCDLPTASRLMTSGLRTFATHHGQAQKYHETMTQFWVRLVAHLVQTHPQISDFEAFIRAFPHLLEKDLPYHHWQRETLMTDSARAHWVEPDVLALPA